MIVTVKNLQQQTFTIEFDPERTVFQLKEKICDERGSDYVVGKQKLIYAGVILDDKRTIASYNIDEKKFVVVMIKRDIGNYVQKPDEGGASTSTPISLITDNETVKENPKERNISVKDESKHKFVGNRSSDQDKKSVENGGRNINKKVAVLGSTGNNASVLAKGSGAFLSGTTVGSDSSETSQSSFSSGDIAGFLSNTSLQSRAESNLLMGEEYNRTVASMIEMGYSRTMVLSAMAASYNNPERAVEYLISGLPEVSDGFNATTAAVGEDNPDNSAAGDGETPRTNSDGGEDVEPPNHICSIDDSLSSRDGEYGQHSSESHNASLGNVLRPAHENPFRFLRNQPQFLLMRSLVYENPDSLHSLLQQIGRTNPPLLQLISENQEAFLSMLNRSRERQTGTNRQNPPPDMTERGAQLAAGGDGWHIRPLDTTQGAGGDAPAPQQRPGESGDARSHTLSNHIRPPRSDTAAEHRAAIAEAFMRERAAAAAAVAELLATASAAVGRDPNEDCGSATNTTATNNVSDSGISENGSVRLTQHDKEAVERLTSLGFPEGLVLQAYFACDKDEQLAANFLISSTFDD
ncbi:UV excision repair protein RAD23 homolog A isoform X1 [Anastrepha ludens]|uniref:UV excision repair protein RAD23 homolog A isoform X1 n=1 Tax=Anastrepha ludens TaxID=28586 RepID=UPI0023AEFE5F|nr:UV excision repair protein RAD23 homolog A isoform X1 [Anastrepha ludens]